MKVISVDIARVVQLFNADEIKPKKGVYLPEFIRAVTEKYGFINWPDVIQRPTQDLKFAGGRLTLENRNINILDLTMYNDGVSLDSSHTDDANHALDNFIEWIQEQYLIEKQITIFPRSYISGLVVQFDGTIDGILSVFKLLQKESSKLLKDVYGADVQINLSRISLRVEQKPTPAIIQEEITIERRVGVPHVANRYYSGAPLPNDIHIQLLEKFERAALHGS